MSVLSKLVTLFRGSVRELGDSVIDANGTRIYEQEIIDARNSIREAKQNLTVVMAKEMQSARDIERLKAEIERYEGLAVEALNKDHETLATDVAAKLAELEIELDAQTKAHSSYALQVSKLKELVKVGEGRVREHERQLALAKTTESVYRATRSISDSIGAGGSRLASAKESLERIRQRHQDLADRIVAGDQLENESGDKALERKLDAAGIGDNAVRATRIMERIKARQAAGKADEADAGDPGPT